MSLIVDLPAPFAPIRTTVLCAMLERRNFGGRMLERRDFWGYVVGVGLGLR